MARQLPIGMYSNGKGNAVFLLPNNFHNCYIMKGTNNKLHTEQSNLNALIGVAQRLITLSNELESLVSGKFLDGLYNDELSSVVDALRDNVSSKLTPVIGTASIEYHTQTA